MGDKTLGAKGGGPFCAKWLSRDWIIAERAEFAIGGIKPRQPSVTLVFIPIIKKWERWGVSGDLRGSGKESLCEVWPKKWVEPRESPICHMELPSGAGEI